VTLLHLPYTAWHLSYVALGTAAASGVIHGDRLAAALGAFFLAVGIGAHALDELNGRPLRTRLSRRALIALLSRPPTTSSWPAVASTPTSGSRCRGARFRRSRATSSRR
jgi:hypothetical protein